MIIEKVDERLPIYGVARSNIGQLRESMGEVDVDDEVVPRSGIRHLGSTDDERHTNILFVYLGFAISQTVFTEVIAVVGRENQIRVFQFAKRGKAIDDALDRFVDRLQRLRAESDTRCRWP